jgi:hypothetical protein
VIVRAIERPRSRPTLRRIAANRLDAAPLLGGPQVLTYVVVVIHLVHLSLARLFFDQVQTARAYERRR